MEGGLTVHTHLRMDGSWRVRAASDRVPASHRIRLILANDTWQAIGYQLGIVEVLRTAQEEQVTGHLGPDLLGPGWDPEEAVRRLRASPGRPAGEALLDQRNLAGVGNLYKSEVLFLRGINPWRPVADIADPAALVELARRLLDANKDRIRPGHHRCAAARRGDLGVRAGGPPLPTLRHPDQDGGPGRRPGRAGHLLVPALPVLSQTRARWPSLTGATGHEAEERGGAGTGPRSPGQASRLRKRMNPAPMAIAA